MESAEATRELAALAETLGAPVATSLYGRGAISDAHPLAVGGGWARIALYDELFEQADLVVVVGSRIDDCSDARRGAAFPERMVRIDIDSSVVEQRQPVEVSLIGDARSTLRALC